MRQVVALVVCLLLAGVPATVGATDGPAPYTTVPELRGSPAFVRQTRWALAWVERAGWGALVREHLALIYEDPALPYAGAMGLTADGRGVAVFRAAHEDLWWYASAIVHEAAHARDYAEGRKYWGPEGEHAADLEQQRFLEAVGSTRRVVRDPATIADHPEPALATLQGLAE